MTFLACIVAIVIACIVTILFYNKDGQQALLGFFRSFILIPEEKTVQGYLNAVAARKSWHWTIIILIGLAVWARYAPESFKIAAESLIPFVVSLGCVAALRLLWLHITSLAYRIFAPVRNRVSALVTKGITYIAWLFGGKADIKSFTKTVLVMITFWVVGLGSFFSGYLLTVPLSDSVYVKPGKWVSDDDHFVAYRYAYIVKKRFEAEAATNTETMYADSVLRMVDRRLAVIQSKWNSWDELDAAVHRYHWDRILKTDTMYHIVPPMGEMRYWHNIDKSMLYIGTPFANEVLRRAEQLSKNGKDYLDVDIEHYEYGGARIRFDSKGEYICGFYWLSVWLDKK